MTSTILKMEKGNYTLHVRLGGLDDIVLFVQWQKDWLFDEHAATATGARDVDGREAGLGHCLRRRGGRQDHRCRRQRRSDKEALGAAFLA